MANTPLTPDDLRFFDRDDDFSIRWNRLPHWTQAGTVVFITWRTEDSMPQSVVRQWLSDRDDILRSHGINPQGDWRARVSALPLNHSLRIKWQLINRFDERLDDCHGACLLRRPDVATIVSDSLLKFDGDRYLLTDFCVMPNHIHLLAAFRTEELATQQIAGWKRFQARQINTLLDLNGAFWKHQSFDHLVRSECQFQHLRRYIANNGIHGHVPADEFTHWTREL
ncbi:MAG: transposase [Planctomycetaceae bacterium]